MRKLVVREHSVHSTTTFPSNGYQLGLDLQARGIKRVASQHNDWLTRARAVAKKIAAETGSVSSDDVHAALPMPEGAHPALMGAVFKNLGLRVVGYTNTCRPQAHGRIIRVYGP
jgi:hypothetical protein